MLTAPACHAAMCWDGGSGCCYTERCAKQNRTRRLKGFAAWRLLRGFEHGSPLISLDRPMHYHHAPARGISRAEKGGALRRELQMNDTMMTKQILLTRQSPAYWRVTFSHPPLNIFGPATIPQLNEIITARETDEHVKVVVFDSAVEGYFLTHYDFLAKLEDTTSLPPGPSRPNVSTRTCRFLPLIFLPAS
jgi:hypothetical protein